MGRDHCDISVCKGLIFVLSVKVPAELYSLPDAGGRRHIPKAGHILRFPIAGDSQSPVVDTRAREDRSRPNQILYTLFRIESAHEKQLKDSISCRWCGQCRDINPVGYDPGLWIP